MHQSDMFEEVLKGEPDIVRSYFYFMKGSKFVSFFLRCICEKKGAGYDGAVCQLPGDIDPFEDETPFNGVWFYSEFYESVVLEYDHFMNLVIQLANVHRYHHPEDKGNLEKYISYLNRNFISNCKLGYEKDMATYNNYLMGKNA